MLKTRVITAILLLAVILPVMLYGPTWSANIVCTVFFAMATWESCRLFWDRYAGVMTTILTVFFGSVISVLYEDLNISISINLWLFYSFTLVSFFAWLFLFLPVLKRGLPKRSGIYNTLFGALYLCIIFACFQSIAIMRVSIVDVNQSFAWTYLWSIMAIVWSADIGAYFFGRAFGRHRLAPSISPGKTWEGAFGGWICVLIVGMIWIQALDAYDSIFIQLKNEWGWLGFVLGLSFLTIVSVVGDLIESQLKRRANVKDSSHLLPGHGGVLDRVDALIFVVPMTVFLILVVNFSNLF